MVILEKLPAAATMEAKPAFEERYRSLLGERYDEFFEYSSSYRRKSIRVNTIKAPVAELRQRLAAAGWKLEQVPWCKEGFWMAGARTDLGNLLEHQLGYMYVQEAASMLPVEALRPEPGELVLDMCAAPGSKTTQAAARMKNTGGLIANDNSGERVKALGMNLQRCGVMNAAITIMRGAQFTAALFDKVLVDAPCSGTGTIRKSPGTLKIWNPLMIKRLAHQQKQLIEAGFSSLKEGGAMVYSTCSLEPEENELNVQWLMDTHKITIEPVSCKVGDSGLTNIFGKKLHSSIANCRRFWPHKTNTEGFFIAKVRKR